MTADLIAFCKGDINLSTWLFARGCSGVTRPCLKPICMALKGGPESVLQTDGMPNIENMRSRPGMTLLAEMEVKASTTGNLL